MSSHNEYITTYGTQKLFFEKDMNVYIAMTYCKKLQILLVGD